MRNRTYCGEVIARSEGERLTLCGWVHRIRNLGGLAFLDLRDHTGVVQITPPPDRADLREALANLHHEDVVQVEGVLKRRPEAGVNPRLATGAFEILADCVELLSSSKTPPFLPEEAEKVQEEFRLKYRYLHLRSEKMQRNLRLLHRLYQAVRRYFDERGFVEIATPFLIKPTPEGARDFLVPSRLHPGRAYALPQSPQIYKQILMVSGFDRYFQIVKCFRDEDLRADRQPEFTQIDVELSFTDEEEIHEIVEGLMVRLFREVLQVEIAVPFERIPYERAQLEYGSDKPDLRIPLRIADLSDLFTGSSFQVFAQALAAGGGVRGLNLPGCGGYTRRQRDQLVDKARGWGMGGLVFAQIGADGVVASTASKFLPETQIKAALARAGCRPGDLLAVGADADPQKLASGMGQLRLWAGKELNLIAKSEFVHCWITEFPMFEFDAELNRFQAAHHPFTSPVPADLERFPEEWGRIRARAYDLVLNGHEIAGGSIRIHQKEIQRRVFHMLGLSPEEAQAKFGFLLEALEMGAPPHGGIAFGLDRLAMIMAGADTIRDVIAFPKTTAALSLMDGSPAATDAQQWAELGLLPITPPEGGKA